VSDELSQAKGKIAKERAEKAAEDLKRAEKDQLKIKELEEELKKKSINNP